MEIYGQFTCDNGAGSVEWTRASPPYSFLSLTAVDESSIWLGPRKGPLFYLVDQDEARGGLPRPIEGTRWLRRSLGSLRDWCVVDR
jgi:hypothetical protein